MKKTVKCPVCGKETIFEIKNFSGIEILLCDDIECETLFAVSWESSVQIEILTMQQPQTR